MAYITAADFREATLAEYCKGLIITDEDMDSTKLALAITRCSGNFDNLTNDHFESASATYNLTGDGSSHLTLPQRCTAVSTVKTKDLLGVQTTQSSSTYRLHSSLVTGGTDTIALDSEDYIAIIPGQYLSLTGYGGRWPCDPASIEVVGTFGWTVTPYDVKRAVALMVYDSVKPMSPTLRKATTYRTLDAQFDYAATGPTNIPEADEIIRQYTRGGGVLVG